jgi:hypothetical protein
MKFNHTLRLAVLLTALFAFAGIAAAQGPVYDTASTTSNLAVSATFTSALQLDIATAEAGSPVSGPAGAYTMSFGNVNGLGLGAAGSNITKTSVTGGFMYTTPISLTPSFSGFTTGAAAAITVGQDTNDDTASKSAAREGAAFNSVSVLPAVASARVVAATASNGTSFDRYIGVFVPNANNSGVALAGSRSMNLVYTITIP